MRRRSVQSGMTLIEVISVAAIIGLLVGLILPGITKVRENALKVYCMSNLRQIGTAVSTYATDCSGRIPSVEVATGANEPTANIHEAGIGADGLGRIYSAYLDNLKVFRRPRDIYKNPAIRITEANIVLWDKGTLGIIRSSYYYRAGIPDQADTGSVYRLDRLKAIAMDNDTQYAIGRYNDHDRGELVEILFVDGSVMGVTDPAHTMASGIYQQKWNWADGQN
ncbi:MAG: type II secretion system protein [Planctomycetota bacterium]